MRERAEDWEDEDNSLCIGSGGGRRGVREKESKTTREEDANTQPAVETPSSLYFTSSSQRGCSNFKDCVRNSDIARGYEEEHTKPQEFHCCCTSAQRHVFYIKPVQIMNL